MKGIVAAAALAAGVSIASAADVQQASASVAGLKVVTWNVDGGAKPVIVFSHGFHGCATQSRFLMRAFARAGYFVIAPNHRDATCNGGASNWAENAAAPFGDPRSWSESTYRDRGDDVARIVDALATDPVWRNKADVSRLGLAGHSLGGYTVLGLAGAWPGWRLARAKAVLALSPYSQPFITHGTLGGIAVPVMYQGGTLDFGITPWITKSQGAYDASPKPKYYVELEGAGHLAWTELRSKFHASIIDYSVAFMDRHVKDAADGASGLANKRSDVAALRSIID